MSILPIRTADGRFVAEGPMGHNPEAPLFHITTDTPEENQALQSIVSSVHGEAYSRCLWLPLPLGLLHEKPLMIFGRGAEAVGFRKQRHIIRIDCGTGLEAVEDPPESGMTDLSHPVKLQRPGKHLNVVEVGLPYAYLSSNRFLDVRFSPNAGRPDMIDANARAGTYRADLQHERIIVTGYCACPVVGESGHFLTPAETPKVETPKVKLPQPALRVVQPQQQSADIIDLAQRRAQRGIDAHGK